MLLSIILSCIVFAVPVQKPAQLNGVCGGFLGIQCVKGLECQYEVSSDPNCHQCRSRDLQKRKNTGTIKKWALLNVEVLWEFNVMEI
ncbi:hypothetical protein HDV02_005003 [Globomyces sp. JEL0801]|nr:hypothetical protein HDV02_005003 [Globomyces sp. JEL0801]